MKDSKNKVIYLHACQQEVTQQKQAGEDGQYQCLLSGQRLDGYCELLIYNRYQKNGELFFLSFCEEKQTTLHYLQEEEILLWKHRHTFTGILYNQAMTLLGDAVRRVYKEQGPQNPWNESHHSVHVQHTWQNEYYNSIQSNLDWLLQEREFVPFIKLYFSAINHNDAVLLYDMLTEDAKHNTVRELYAYNWNHVLEDVNIIDFAVIDGHPVPESVLWMYYLTICGEYPNGEILSVDVCLHLTREHGYVRLQEEQVLEASHISSCCREL